MKTFLCMTCAGLLLTLSSMSQSWRIPVASPGWGAMAYSRQFFDPTATRANAAALSQVNEVTGSVYGERAFMLSPAQTIFAMAASPALSGVCALSCSLAGYPDFHEYDLGFAYARTLGANSSLGLRCGYYALHIPGYFNAGAVETEISVLFRPMEKFTMGLQICNPFGAGLGKKGTERLATLIGFAFGYDFSASFYLGCVIQKIRGHPPGVNPTLHFQPTPALGFEAGLETTRGMVWFAPVFRFGRMQLRVNVSRHPTLGFSQGLGILCKFHSGRKESADKNEIRKTQDL